MISEEPEVKLMLGAKYGDDFTVLLILDKNAWKNIQN